MNRAPEVVSRIEEMGGSLVLDGDGSIRYRVPKDNPESQALLEAVRAEKQNLLAYLRARHAVNPEREETQPIPTGATLRAPRFDGYGRALKTIPACWCCFAPWQLERLQAWQGETIAWLKPSCGCLDIPQALSCCGLCIGHCRCAGRK